MEHEGILLYNSVLSSCNWNFKFIMVKQLRVQLQISYFPFECYDASSGML